MKTLRSLFFLIIITIISIQYNTPRAQVTTFEMGLEGGPSLRSLRGNTILDSTAKSDVGYSGGIYGQYNIDRMWSVKLGVNYEKKGAKFDIQSQIGTGIVENFKSKSDLNYITIPLLVKATFGQKIKFFVNAGAYIGILLKQETKTEANSIQPASTVDGTDNFKKTDIGISGGIGVKIPLSPRFGLTLEVRENLGLTNTSKVQVVDNGSIKTNAINLLAGFSYSMGKMKRRR